MVAEGGGGPFCDLPAALVEEVLSKTAGLGNALLGQFEETRSQREERRSSLLSRGWLRHESELAQPPIPTTCGVDGSYAVERLLATDVAAAAAVGVEGLTPPSETRHWHDPHHLVFISPEPHNAATSLIARAVMIGQELSLAVGAPHDVVFLDGSFTTPLIYLNQALNQVHATGNLSVTGLLLNHATYYLDAYHATLESRRSDRACLAVPKYTSNREIGQALGWPEQQDDRAALTASLSPGEFTPPIRLQPPQQPWHINTTSLEGSNPTVAGLAQQIVALLSDVRVVHYRPNAWMPALRLELPSAVAGNPGRLAVVLQAVRHQSAALSVAEPFPLYMADRMVKQLARAIPTFRQIASQQVAERYGGDIGDIYLGLHGYRTESGA